MKLIQYATQMSQYNGPFGPKDGWAAAGMGYVVKTDDGELVVIDGGWESDAQGLVETLEKQANGQKPVVALWIITHPHEDHYYVLREIAQNEALCARVEIRKIAYDFSEIHLLNEPTPQYPQVGNIHMQEILSKTGAKAVKPRVGDIFSIAELEIKILFTPDGVEGLPNSNFMSLIFIMENKKTGRRCMITGDAAPSTMQTVVDRFAGALRCDMLQLPHHGLCDTGNKAFYDEVSPEIVLIPTCVAGDTCMRAGLYGDAPEVNLEVERNAKKVYKAFEGTMEIDF